MKILKLWFDKDNIYIKTDRGHVVGNPLHWFERLAKATAEQRNNYNIYADGIHWKDIDEDLSLAGFFKYKTDFQ